MNQDQMVGDREDGSPAPLRERVDSLLFAPVDIAALACFRVVFGVVVAWEVWRYITLGWVEYFFVGRAFHFTFWPFSFVAPWPGWGMKAHFIVLGIAGLMMAAGLFYRAAAAIVFFGVAYIFLLDKSYYLNHIYLLSLVAFLMLVVPAHKAWSVDSVLRPRIRSRTVPGWTLWLLRFQIALPYFYGGISKLSPDWLQGQPLKIWLPNDSDFPLIGPLLTEEWVAVLMSYGALVLDLGMVYFLLLRKTRPFAYAIAVIFHLMNSRLFSIGIFPWLMIAATALFFPPDWPRRVFADLRNRPGSLRSLAWWSGMGLGAAACWIIPTRFHWVQVVIGAFGGALMLFSMVELMRPMLPPAPDKEQAEPDGAPGPAERSQIRPVRLVTVLLAIWMGVHLLVPFRHFLVPDNVYWTEEGQRFSWMMLVRSKQGTVNYLVTDPSRGQTWEVDPASYLTPRQASTLKDKPDMILQFAHFLRDEFRESGYPDVEVRVHSAISLNGRSPRPMIDPTVDLSRIEWPWFGHADWLTPGPVDPPPGARDPARQ